MEKSSSKNILIAFLLNITFSALEFFGGFFTNSVAIMSDAIHDLGDALSIGISFFLELKSKKGPNKKYTYGYVRYSVLGGALTTATLIAGSLIVIYNSVIRLFNPEPVNNDAMIGFAVFGVVINFLAAYATREKSSINQKAVNLHMLEDVLGWVVVLIGSLVMRFTGFTWIDSVMSIGVALFVLINALGNFKQVLDLFLAKTPTDVDIDELRRHVLEIPHVKDVHHIHAWSIDGYKNFATMHIVANRCDIAELKEKIREELREHKIEHVTLEIESEKEDCDEEKCDPMGEHRAHHHHHHHH